MFTTKNLLLLIGRHALVALIATSIASAIIFPLSQEIKKTSARTSQARELARSLEKRTELFLLLRRDAEIIGTNDTLIEKAFLSSGNILEFTSALEHLALKNSFMPNFKFGNPQPSPLESSFPLTVITYNHTLSPNIESLIAYLKEFEQLPYFTKINSLTFSSQDPLGWINAGIASFNASFYTKSET
jgi:type II secretory pathway pseudopilin PulG